MIASRQQTTMSGELSWKGSVLLVGMLALLMLLSGCYTIVATSQFSGGVSSATDYTYMDDEVYEEAATAGTKIPMKVSTDAEASVPVSGQQGIGVGIPASGVKTGMNAVGVRYRNDYEYQGEEYYDDYYYDDAGYGDQYYDGYDWVSDPNVVVVGYRRPWIRRLQVDWYYGNCYGWNRWPSRFGSVWSVGWRWGGFGVSWGRYDPYWYDPFYWDYWCSDPFHSYQASYMTYWDPWYYDRSWGWGWHGGWNYRSYHYGYYDPYWGPYHYYDNPWYGGRSRGVVIVEDYERRPADRRRGLTDLRDSRRAVGTGSSRAVVASGDDAGDNMRRDSRTRAGSDTRTAATGDARTGNDTRTRSGAADVRTPTRASDRTTTTRTPTQRGVDGKIRQTPPANSGSSRLRETARAVGNELIRRYTGRSVGSRSSSGDSRTRTTTRLPTTSSGNRGTVSRPPTTSSRTRTTSSRPPPTSSRTRTTSSRPPPTSSRTRTTSSRPPPTSSRTRTTSSRPPTTSSRTRTTTSRPPPRTTSRPPPRTTSRPPPSTSSRSRTTTSRPPPSTTSRPPSSSSSASRSTSSRSRTTTSRPPGL